MIRSFAATLAALAFTLQSTAQSPALAGAPVTGDVQLSGAGMKTQTFSRLLTQSVLASWPTTRAQVCAELKSEIENPHNYPSVIKSPAGDIPMTVHPKITSCTTGPSLRVTGWVTGDTIHIAYEIDGNSLAGTADGTVGPMPMVPTQQAGADYTATFDLNVIVTALVPPPGMPVDIHAVSAGWHNVKPTMTLRGSPIVTAILNPMLPNALAGIEKSRLNLPQLRDRVTPSLTTLNTALVKVNPKTYGYYSVAFQGSGAQSLIFHAMKGAPPAVPGK
jgi:hypothetical protein